VLKCLNYLFTDNEFSSEETQMFQQLVAPMLRVLQACIETQDEDLSLLTFDTFNFIVIYSA